VATVTIAAVTGWLNFRPVENVITIRSGSFAIDSASLRKIGDDKLIAFKSHFVFDKTGDTEVNKCVVLLRVTGNRIGLWTSDIIKGTSHQSDFNLPAGSAQVQLNIGTQILASDLEKTRTARIWINCQDQAVSRDERIDVKALLCGDSEFDSICKSARTGATYTNGSPAPRS
jgi:hypothetical protein